jgi:large subunit ribosomal protein L17
MRHGLKHRKLNRNSSHRRALLRNLAIALIERENITTTLPKAKELRPYVERLMTLARKGDLASYRLVISRLGNNKLASKKLFSELAPKYKDRNGGYTGIYKIGFRKDDASPMAVIKWV